MRILFPCVICHVKVGAKNSYPYASGRACVSHKEAFPKSKNNVTRSVCFNSITEIRPKQHKIISCAICKSNVTKRSTISIKDGRICKLCRSHPPSTSLLIEYGVTMTSEEKAELTPEKRETEKEKRKRLKAAKKAQEKEAREAKKAQEKEAREAKKAAEIAELNRLMDIANESAKYLSGKARQIAIELKMHELQRDVLYLKNAKAYEARLDYLHQELERLVRSKRKSRQAIKAENATFKDKQIYFEGRPAILTAHAKEKLLRIFGRVEDYESLAKSLFLGAREFGAISKKGKIKRLINNKFVEARYFLNDDIRFVLVDGGENFFVVTVEENYYPHEKSYLFPKD